MSRITMCHVGRGVTSGAKFIAYVLALLWLPILLILPRPAHGQEEAWSTPTLLSNPQIESWFPDIAIDNFGQRHVLWSATDDVDTYDLVMHVQSLEGQLWSPANDIIALKHAPGLLSVTRPTFAIGSAGELTFGLHGPNNYLYLAQAAIPSAQNAAAWRVTQLDGAGYHVVPVYDKRVGLLHVVLTQGAIDSPCHPCLQVQYVHGNPDTGLSSSPLSLSQPLNLGAAKPQVLPDRQGGLHVVWEAGGDGDRGYVIDPAQVVYAASLDGGDSWSAPFRLAPEPGDDPQRQARNVAIGLTGDGDLVTAWWSMPDNAIYYRVSTDHGKNWSPRQAIPGVAGIGTASVTRQDGAVMVTDSAGNVHLIVVGRRAPEQAELNLIHLTWDGARWSQPDVIATYKTDLPEWPRAAIGYGNQLHVVWHVRPQALADRTVVLPPQVWYAARAVDAPEVAPVGLASLATAPDQRNSQAATTAAPPASTATVERYLAPELAREPKTVVTLRSLMTENDEVALLALSLLPGALLIGLTWFTLRKGHKTQ